MNLLRRTASAIVTVLVAGVVLSGCSTEGDPAGSASASGGETGAASSDAPAAVAVPKPPTRGACFRLTVSAALRATNSAKPVRCSSKHTAVTVSVGRLETVVDGHLLAVDSARVQRQVATKCRALVDRHVGGSQETQRLARVQAVWFSPTLAQSDRGALWFRCDLVIASGSRGLVDLPRTTAGLLSRPGALSRYGTCGTSAPATKSFIRVVCGARHTWRARTTIPLPRDAGYLAKSAGKRADARCRDVAAARTRDSGRLRWSFEWPTKAQWAAGQRYGLCWTPDRVRETS